ncbi:MAG: hypothetical protein BWZ10_01346 [candidate division BRC1 bacterium ADurb.BinA364]|nr:MAG: hypothetical protein BWZ10_01346 [candidate division BRC1 bacterium ADurb.BinA364]
MRQFSHTRTLERLRGQRCERAHANGQVRPAQHVFDLAQAAREIQIEQQAIAPRSPSLAFFQIEPDITRQKRDQKSLGADAAGLHFKYFSRKERRATRLDQRVGGVERRLYPIGLPALAGHPVAQADPIFAVAQHDRRAVERMLSQHADMALGRGEQVAGPRRLARGAFELGIERAHRRHLAPQLQKIPRVDAKNGIGENAFGQDRLIDALGIAGAIVAHSWPGGGVRIAIEHVAAPAIADAVGSMRLDDEQAVQSRLAAQRQIGLRGLARQRSQALSEKLAIALGFGIKIAAHRFGVERRYGERHPIGREAFVLDDCRRVARRSHGSLVEWRGAWLAANRQSRRQRGRGQRGARGHSDARACRVAHPDSLFL